MLRLLLAFFLISGILGAVVALFKLVLAAAVMLLGLFLMVAILSSVLK
jgi:hypothetical protein